MEVDENNVVERSDSRVGFEVRVGSGVKLNFDAGDDDGVGFRKQSRGYSFHSNGFTITDSFYTIK